MTNPHAIQPATAMRYDAVVIGAGFAGLYMLHRLRQLGMSAHVYEAGDGIGGTWYWNCYPGARCDVDSMQYCYSWTGDLQRSWQWTERYPTRDEILRYIHHVADRYDLKRDITLATRIEGGGWDSDAGVWRIHSNRGHDIECRFLITATGCLSESQRPDIPGLEQFEGQIHHTSRWPKDGVDLRGKRVAVMGTGSSGIQIVPELARQASELIVLQRTPNFSIPAWNGPIDPAHQQRWHQNYPELRARARATRSGILYDYGTQSGVAMSDEARREEMERRWNKGGANFVHAFNDTFTNKASNDFLAEFVRDKIRRTVRDPSVAETLSPRDHAIGTKRICVDSGYYETFNLPHVRLVDLRTDPVERFEGNSLVTTRSRYDIDAMVFATGFDAVTGALERLNLRGEQGLTFKQLWTSGPTSYLGLMTVGFPNLFTITGPGSPSILTNVIVSIEQHVDWISDCLAHMKQHGFRRIDPEQAAQDAWGRKVQDIAAGTLFVTANSWYMGANVPGKPKLFLPFIGGFSTYSDLCKAVVEGGYQGFRFSVDSIHRSFTTEETR